MESWLDIYEKERKKKNNNALNQTAPLSENILIFFFF